MSLWARFDKHFPKADPSRFRVETFFGRDNIMFIEKNGDENAVFDDDTGEVRKSIYYSGKMKKPWVFLFQYLQQKLFMLDFLLN